MMKNLPPVLTLIAKEPIELDIMPLKVDGVALRSEILISDSLVKNIAIEYASALHSEIMNSDVFYYDDNDEILFNKDKLRLLLSGFQDDLVWYGSDIVSTIVHELTHIIQHTKQPKNKKTEYRSYIEKDKSKFYDAIRRLGTKDQQPGDSKIHRSSPQEITAHANETALYIVSEISSIRNLNTTDISELKGVIIDLEEFLSGNSSITTSRHYLMKTYISDFKHSPNGYKIYKRYIKQVASNLFSFINHIKKRIKDLEDLDQYLDKWAYK
jgi:hypothetical protein